MSIEVVELVDNALGTLSVLTFGAAGTQDVVMAAAVKSTAALALAVADVAAALREPKKVLPTGPATPAGPVALGELPWLREFPVHVGNLTCNDGCPPDQEQIIWQKKATVREMLATIAAHRRQYHMAPAVPG